MMESISKRRRVNHPYNTPHSFNLVGQRDDTLSFDQRCSSVSHPRLPSPQTSIRRTQIEIDSYPASIVDDGMLEQSVDDGLEQVIMAIDMRDSGTVGCSYYSSQEETLYLMGDIQFGGSEFIDSC